MAAHAQSSAQRITTDRHYTGPLETFLNETKSPGLETKVFGSFEGEEKASVTFKAIISNTSKTGVRSKSTGVRRVWMT